MDNNNNSNNNDDDNNNNNNNNTHSESYIAFLARIFQKLSQLNTKICENPVLPILLIGTCASGCCCSTFYRSIVKQSFRTSRSVKITTSHFRSLHGHGMCVTVWKINLTLLNWIRAIWIGILHVKIKNWKERRLVQGIDRGIRNVVGVLQNVLQKRIIKAKKKYA